MDCRVAIGRSNRIGEQQATSICRIAIAPGHPGQERQEGRLERILEQDRQIETLPPQLPGQGPLSGQARMASLGIVGQDARQGWMACEKICHARLDQQ